MLVVVYTGDPSDPLSQRMELRRAKSLEDAKQRYPQAICVAAVEKRAPSHQAPPDYLKLRRGAPVWSY
jgi:hypothetical protein